MSNTVVVEDHDPIQVVEVAEVVGGAGGGGTPAGPAGGDLAGTYPNPQIAAGVIVDADVSASAGIVTSKIAGLDTALSGKAPLGSPALTGTPTAPTAAANTNTTQVATTAFAVAQDAALVPKSVVDAKGDLLAGSANDTVARVGVGSDGQVLTADAASPAGLKWSAASVGQPAGSVIFTNSTTRPSSRTDLLCIFTGTTDPGLAALDGDIWMRTT